MANFTTLAKFMFQIFCFVRTVNAKSTVYPMLPEQQIRVRELTVYKQVERGFFHRSQVLCSYVPPDPCPRCSGIVDNNLRCLQGLQKMAFDVARIRIVSQLLGKLSNNVLRRPQTWVCCWQGSSIGHLAVQVRGEWRFFNGAQESVDQQCSAFVHGKMQI